MSPRCQPCWIDLDQEVAAAVHQVKVGWVRHPGCGAGHHKLPVEALFVCCWPVVVVKEDWFNFDWDLLSTLCFVASQMYSFVAATPTANCKLDIAGGRVLTGNQVAESTFNIQEPMALAKLTGIL